MMNCQSLTKLFLTFFFGYSARLASIFISFEYFSSLACPIWPIMIPRCTVNILWMIFTYSMVISALSATILTSTFSCSKSTFILCKGITAIQTGKFNLTFIWSSFYSSILTFRRAMFASTVVKSARYNMKYTLTILTSSFDLLFQKKNPLFGWLRCLGVAQ